MRAALMRVTLAAALCLAAGCGKESPTPKPYTGPSKSASASASPTAAPTLPPEARGSTEASAKAFVRFYLSTLSYAAVTGDIDQLASLAGSDCVTCRDLTSGLTKIYRQEGSIRGRGYSSQTLSLVGDIEGPSVRLEGSVQFYPQTITQSKSAKSTRTTGGPERCRFTLSHDQGSWLVEDWKIL